MARPQANGSTDPATKTVIVRDDLSPAHAVKTFVHERAHMLLGHVDSVASYMVCRGVCDVARWANGDIELVRKTAERVVTVARSILSGLQPADEAA